MSPEVQRQFEQAAECLEDARILLENNRLSPAMNWITGLLSFARGAGLVRRRKISAEFLLFV